MSDAPGSDSGKSIKTPLTPNTACECVATGLRNDYTELQFLGNDFPFWNPTVSITRSSAKNDQDRGDGIVAFKNGLTVEYSSLPNSMYTVTVTGDIVDSGTTYPLKGKSLGTFHSRAN